MNKKELTKAFQDNLITEEKKEELFKIETAPKPKRKGRKLPVCISFEEFEKIIKVTKNKRYRLAYMLGWMSGLRISEAVKLPPPSEDDLNYGRLRIENAKGGKDRVVPLPKGFRKEYLELMPLIKHFKNKSSAIRSIQIAFKRAAKRAGITEYKPSVHFHCVDEATEILTKKGWKKHKDVKKGDKIFSYNIKKEIIEDDIVKEVSRFESPGEMISIKNSYLDCLFSKEHKDLLNIAHIKTINKERVSSIWDGWKLIQMNKFLGMPNKRLIKKKVSGIYEGKESIGRERAGILGWILTDGCIHKRPNRNYEIVIVQSYDINREKCEIIKELLIDSGIEHTINLQKPNKTRYNPDGRIMVFRLSSKGKNLDWIFSYLTTDKKPKFNLLNLKQEELRELYSMMMLGDGCNNREFCCQNKEIVEFLQMLCVLIGKRCLLSSGNHNVTNKTKLRTWITDHDEANVLASHINKVNYNGIIWCPTTRNNTWIARRNGKVFITGNSLRHGFATHGLDKGMPIHDVRTLMGHSNISTTNIYLEANPKKAMENYRELF